jgi:hypothetical protein
MNINIIRNAAKYSKCLFIIQKRFSNDRISLFLINFMKKVFEIIKSIKILQ